MAHCNGYRARPYHLFARCAWAQTDRQVLRRGVLPSGGTETYGYDNQRDFLTGVNYGDCSPTAQQAWTYDRAGNRSTTGQAAGQFDNLNRMTSGGSNYQNDLLGNRLWKNYMMAGVQRYVYDELNRATSICGAQDGAAYTYRADGMRVQKVSGLTIAWNPNDTVKGSGWYDDIWGVNKATTRYFYDGQMCMEENFTPAQGSVGTAYVTRYGLGARGIDYIEKTVAGGSPSKAYPLYDGHGNMLATISLFGTFSNKRAYDVWGGVRTQSGVDGVNPSERHVGNLGHKADDESGLIYMRARYYDPSSGRFVSQDPAMDGANWFVYCGNDPVNAVDFDGKHWAYVGPALVALFAPLRAAFALLWKAMGTGFEAFSIGAAGLAFNLAWFADILGIQVLYIFAGGVPTFEGSLLLTVMSGFVMGPAAWLQAAASATIRGGASLGERVRAAGEAYAGVLIIYFALETLRAAWEA